MKRTTKRLYIFFALLVLFILGGKSVVYSDISVDNLKKKYVNEYSKFIEIDKMQVHYRDEGLGEVIVLLHGTASSLHTWDDWTLDLSKNYRVIRLDLPAFGLTGANSTGDYSISSYTKFLHRFLSKINVTHFYLVGNSLGGNIAWNYTAEYPDKVKKLILVDSSGLPTNKEEPWIFKLAKTPILNTLFLFITPKIVVEKNMKQVYADDSKVTDKLITRYHEMALRKGNRKAFIERAKTDFKLDLKSNLDKLKSIETTTLLLWGENDVWIPLENGKKMDSLLRNSQLIVLKNAGHVPMEEIPSKSLKPVLSFLNALHLNTNR